MPRKGLHVTGTGKIKRKHAYKSHILTKKTKKRKRNLGHFTEVSGADLKNVKTYASVIQLVLTYFQH